MHTRQRDRGVAFVRALAADPTAVPRVPELDRDGWIYEQDYMRDLPYDYTTLVENIIDPSHVPVSHHGTVQGDRALAQPLPLVAAPETYKRHPRS